jgi:hypothetical protein
MIKNTQEMVDCTKAQLSLHTPAKQQHYVYYAKYNMAYTFLHKHIHARCDQRLTSPTRTFSPRKQNVVSKPSKTNQQHHM